MIVIMYLRIPRASIISHVIIRLTIVDVVLRITNGEKVRPESADGVFGRIGDALAKGGAEAVAEVQFENVEIFFREFGKRRKGVSVFGDEFHHDDGDEGDTEPGDV